MNKNKCASKAIFDQNERIKVSSLSKYLSNFLSETLKNSKKENPLNLSKLKCENQENSNNEIELSLTGTFRLNKSLKSNRVKLAKNSSPFNIKKLLQGCKKEQQKPLKFVLKANYSSKESSRKIEERNIDLTQFKPKAPSFSIKRSKFSERQFTKKIKPHFSKSKRQNKENVEPNFLLRSFYVPEYAKQLRKSEYPPSLLSKTSPLLIKHFVTDDMEYGLSLLIRSF